MNVPSTAATRVLKAQKVEYAPHLYRYEPHGGTATSAKALGVDEHAVVKTLVMEDERAAPLLVLMHGDCEVSVKELARQLGVKRVEPCTPEVAQRHTGYLVGGTSPFGTKKALPVYVQQSVLALPRVYVNGGSRGFLVALDPRAFATVLNATPVDVALAHERP